MKNLGVMVSGTGSILEYMIQAGLNIGLVLADKQCRGLEIARQAGIDTVVVDRRDYGFVKPGKPWDRDSFSAAVAAALNQPGIEIAAMAGFMTVLSKPFRDAYGAMWLNTHPSLLPAFPGEHAVRDALAYGVKVTGCTIHHALLKVDAGPIVAQEPVRILPGDTEASLHERIKQAERPLYTETVRRLQAGELTGS